MLMNIYSPLSLVAESATMDSTLTLMLKEESITNTILRMETSVMKEYYASKKREWKTILESGDNQDIITEGMLSSLGEFISNFFTRIIDFIKGLFSSNSDISTDIAEKKKTADELTKKEEAKPANPAVKKITELHGIDTCIIDEKVFGLTQVQFLINALDYIEKVIDAANAEDYEQFDKLSNDDFIFSTADKALPKEMAEKLMKNAEPGNFPELKMEYVKEVVFNFKKYDSISIKDMKVLIDKTSMSNIDDAIAGSKKLHDALIGQNKRLKPKIAKLSKIISDNTDKTIDPGANVNASIITQAAKYVGKIVSIMEGATYQCLRVYKNMLTQYNKAIGAPAEPKDVSESCIIHGEVVDADSIFDNGDDDFGHDEWLDLSLKEECKFETRIEEINAQRYLNECIILASEATHLEKIRAIRSITEAEAKQSKNIVSRAIDGIKRIFQKFLEKLRSIGKDNTKYLIKYKKVILETKPMAQKIKMKDCFTGIDRLTKAKIGQFNYDAIKGKMETPEAAQEWLKQQLPAVNDDALNGIKEFRTWCLAYFCVAPESPLKEFEMSDPAQINMTDVYNFMFDIKKIESQLSSDQKGLEETANSFATAAEKISHEVNPTQAAAATTEAMAWSVVYNKVLTEAVIHELEKVTDAKAAPAEDPARASSNVANSTEDAPDAEKSLKAANVAGSNEELQKVKLHTDNYTAAVRTFFTAKLTATEVIRGELMQLVRLHVKNFIKDDTQGTTGKAVGSNYSA